MADDAILGNALEKIRGPLAAALGVEAAKVARILRKRACQEPHLGVLLARAFLDQCGVLRERVERSGDVGAVLTVPEGVGRRDGDETGRAPQEALLSRNPRSECSRSPEESR